MKVLSTPNRMKRGREGHKEKMVDPQKPNTMRMSRVNVLLRGIGRILMNSFFSRIEVVGAEKFPLEGPVMIVANHGNSLVDGVLVSCFLPRMPRLLAASILWDYKPLVPLLKAAGVVPVYRQQDVGMKMAKDKPLFERSSEVLANTGVLSVFPEGLSHNQPHLLPLKSGAARIALEAEAQGEDLGVQILPVGLTFEDKATFRSRVLMQVGEPIGISKQAQVYRATDDVATRRAVVRDLTGRIQQELSEVTLNFSSWEDAQVIRQATELWQHTETWAESGLDAGTLAAMKNHVRMQRTFCRGYAWAKRNRPEQVEQALSMLERYTAARGEEVPPEGKLAGFSLRWPRVTLFALMPMWLIGSVLNFVPFHVSRWFAHGKDEDKMATWSLFSSLLLFPGSWLIQAAMLGALIPHATQSGFNWTVFWSAFVLAPAAGYLTLTYLDLRQELRDRVRARQSKAAEHDLQLLRTELSASLENMVLAYVSRPEAATRHKDQQAEKN